MENVVKYLLYALILTSVQISFTQSHPNEMRRVKIERRHHPTQMKDNICEITDRESKVHCYCESTEIETATKADCWIFNGGIEENDTIWKSFDTQPHIEKLTFNVRSDGALKFIPLYVINYLKSLEKLSIHYATLNKIEKLTFSNMSALREITLMNNKITEIDFSAFANLPSLVNLTVKENKVTEIQRDVFVNLPSLRYLDLSFNSINLAHDGCFDHLSSLSDLILESNSISVLTRDTFRGLGNLTRLDLRSNKVSMIGDLTFMDLWNLNELLLDNNELTFLSARAFDGLALLKKLSMTGNKLRSLNDGLLEGVRGLELLDLRNNELQYFSNDNVKPILENLKVASVLYLTGNQLICDCRLSWIPILRNETKSEPLRIALDEVTCTLPEDTNTEKNEEDSISDEEDILDTSWFPKEDNEDGVTEAVRLDFQIRPIMSSQIALVNIPPETLPCPNRKPQNRQGSLMLSSKGWPSSSSYKSTLNLFSIPLLITSCVLL